MWSFHWLIVCLRFGGLCFALYVSIRILEKWGSLDQAAAQILFEVTPAGLSEGGRGCWGRAVLLAEVAGVSPVLLAQEASTAYGKGGPRWGLCFSRAQLVLSEG